MNLNNLKKLIILLPVLLLVGCKSESVETSPSSTSKESTEINESSSDVNLTTSNITSILDDEQAENIKNNLLSSLPKIYTASHILTVPENTDVTVESRSDVYVAHLSVDGVEFAEIHVKDSRYDFVGLDNFATYGTVESRVE